MNNIIYIVGLVVIGRPVLSALRRAKPLQAVTPPLENRRSSENRTHAATPS